jgi:site-specific DNA recombinase
VTSIRTKSRKQNNNRKSTHLFSNLLFCSDCGKGMHFKKNRHGYVCGNFDKNGKYGGCTSHTIRESDLEQIILKDIEVILKNLKLNYSNKINSKINKEKLLIKKLK